MKKITLLIALISILAFNAAALEEVQVGLYVLNLGKFDIATGSFTADFYLSMKCETKCSPEKFEFMNGRATTIDKIIDTDNEKFYRIQANLNNPIDLRRFPFDVQKMEIIIEDKEKSMGELKYVPLKAESGIDKSIFFSGWNIDGWEAEAKEHSYDIYDEVFSQYVFTINISKIAFNSFLKTFLPIIFMVLILMFSFIMDLDKITSRLAVATSSLVAAVMFHISISNQIPPVGYMTIADKLMILTYLFILATVILNVTILELIERKKQDVAERMHRLTEYSVFIVVPIVYITFFILALLL